jgi:5-(carboxyamino)imidazole ribonucleotide synthase
MINIIGQIPAREEVLAVEGAHLHLYGKAPTERRKVGHVTLVAESATTIERGMAVLGRVLGTG